MKHYLVNYAKGLVGQYFQSPGSTTLAIYLSGAPSVPSDKTKYASMLAEKGIDMIAPDYYGFGRSSGVFDVKGCIQTAYDTTQVFRDKLPLIDVYGTHEILPSHYDEIVVIGSSYGGRVAAAMPKFDEHIEEVVLLAPFLEAGLGEGEEGDEDFLRHYLLGYKGMYRVNESYETLEAMLGFEKLFDRDNLEHLESVKIFVGHGSADTAIKSERSKGFVEDLQTQFPDGGYKYAEYYGLGHGGIMSRVALQGWLQRKEEREGDALS